MDANSFGGLVWSFVWNRLNGMIGFSRDDRQISTSLVVFLAYFRLFSIVCGFSALFPVFQRIAKPCREYTVHDSENVKSFPW